MFKPSGLNVNILSQPNDTTCGPTCLHSVYQYLGLSISIDDVIGSTYSLEDGGTLGVFLGLDALKRGLKATIYSYNLRIFDPTWDGISKTEMIAKLREQLQYKKGKKFLLATNACIEFLEKGGEILFHNLEPSFLKKIITNKTPIIAGLSATYLYQSKREYTNSKDQSVYHDIKGAPMGHFVVIRGIKGSKVQIADPDGTNPLSKKKDNYYEVDVL